MICKKLLITLTFFVPDLWATNELVPPDQLESLFTPRKTQAELTKEAINSYGEVITDGIFHRMGIAYTNVDLYENVHKRIFDEASMDDRAILFVQSIMEGKEICPFVSRSLVPGFWKFMKYFSGLGKYALTASAPVLSVMYTYFENDKKYDDVAFTLNVASLIAFQFGTYAFNNIYNYSSNLSDYYSNIVLEKKLLKATINYQMPDAERHVLSDVKKPGNKDAIWIQDEYFYTFGKIGTELARSIIKEEKNTQKHSRYITAAPNSYSLKTLYRISNLCYWGAGICKALSNLCGMANTVLAALAISYDTTDDEDFTNIFILPQIISAASTLVLGEASKLFKAGACNLSRKIIAYPVYNQDLLNEINEQHGITDIVIE